jgi:hypothetical protein
VLPGPEEALPPVEPIFIAIWRKHFAISDFVKIPLFFWSFPKNIRKVLQNLLIFMIR